MSKFSRNKGARAERELAKLLELELGNRVVRNLEQTRDGGIDLTGVPFAVEVKAQRKPQIATWWAQAVEQAKACGKAPVLAYKVHYRGWRIRIPLAEISQGIHHSLKWDYEWTADISLEAFCFYCREKVEPQPGDKVRVSGVPYAVELGR